MVENEQVLNIDFQTENQKNQSENQSENQTEIKTDFQTEIKQEIKKSNRGGRRPGAGRKKKLVNENINENTNKSEFENEVTINELKFEIVPNNSESSETSEKIEYEETKKVSESQSIDVFLPIALDTLFVSIDYLFSIYKGKKPTPKELMLSDEEKSNIIKLFKEAYPDLPFNPKLIFWFTMLSISTPRIIYIYQK
jgi:hypothetical protein